MTEPKRFYTSELRTALRKGGRIVCSVAPYEGREVEYAPRAKNDPTPWRLEGMDDDMLYRYHGRECHAVDVPVAVTDIQRRCLKIMQNFSGTWHSGGAWMWGNRSQTLRIMRALEKKGLVRASERYEEYFEITDAGKKVTPVVTKVEPKPQADPQTAPKPVEVSIEALREAVEGADTNFTTRKAGPTSIFVYLGTVRTEVFYRPETGEYYATPQYAYTGGVLTRSLAKVTDFLRAELTS